MTSEDARELFWLVRTARTASDWAEERRSWVDGLSALGQTEITGYFYFPDEANAHEAADALREWEYEVTVSPLSELGPWRVTAQSNTVVSEANFEFLDERYTRVAQELGGDHFALTVRHTR